MLKDLYYAAVPNFTSRRRRGARSFVWTTRYEANELPAEATPAWTYGGGGGLEEINPAGVLHLLFPISDSYSIEQPFSDSTGSTIEWRFLGATLDTLVTSERTMTITHTNDYGWVDLSLYSDKLVFENSAGGANFVEDFDASIPHTIRVTMKDNNGSLYVDGTLKSTISLNNDYSTAGIIWALNGNEVNSLDAEIDYIYWRTDGAFQP